MKRTVLITTFLTWIALAPMAHSGPQSTGGGKIDPTTGLPSDFSPQGPDPAQGGELIPDPMSARWFQEPSQEFLYPWLKTLEEKVPGSAAKVLSGFHDMTWYVGDPVNPSADGCKLFVDTRFQGATQIGSDVGFSRKYLESGSAMGRAGLLLHELVMHQSGKTADQCSIPVEKLVDAIASSNSTQDELRNLLQKLTPENSSPYLSFYTRQEADWIKSWLPSKFFVDNCKKNDPQHRLEPVLLIPREALEQIFETRGKIRFPGPWAPMFEDTGSYDGQLSSDALLEYFASKIPSAIFDGSDEFPIYFGSREKCDAVLQSIRDALGAPGSDSDRALAALLSASSIHPGTTDGRDVKTSQMPLPGASEASQAPATVGAAQ